MNVLVTGAAGFVGYHLSSHLLARKFRVTMVDDNSRGPKDKFFDELTRQPGAKFLKLDLADPRSYEQLGKGYDAVFHLAAINGTKNFYEKPDEVLRVDLLAVIYMLEWFVSSGSRKFLFASTSETYAGSDVPIPTPETVPLVVADPFNPRWSYGGSKIAGELLVINYARRRGFPFSILRYNNVYGPRAGYDHVIPAFIMRLLKKEDPFRIYGADHTRTFCYAEDAASASVLAMESPKADGKIIHIGSDLEGEIVIRDLARMMFELFNAAPRVEELPAPAGSPLRRRPLLAVLNRDLGFTPKISIREGLLRTYDWYKKNGQ
ncbi:MAG: NAD(P)-dependent oxidoreductase [Elusimicrobia bacterium]|nr:NAD(P)-dependent oxidoreductase [Elusimicrobiota bacterium]